MSRRHWQSTFYRCGWALSSAIKKKTQDILQRLKDDHDLSKEILLTMRGKVANSSPQKQIKNASFFMTAEEEGQY